jgi:hypothetical protein
LMGGLFERGFGRRVPSEGGHFILFLLAKHLVTVR